MNPPTPPTWRALLPAFATHQRAAQQAPDTIRLYGYRLADLAAAHPRPDRVTTAHLEQFLAEASGGAGKRHQMRAAFRAFYRWARRAGLVTHDPAADLPAIRVPAGVPNPCPDLVIRNALDAAAPRTRLMLLLAAYAGLRCCEIANVHARDWDGYRLHVIGKGRKPRLVRIRRAELVGLLGELEGYAFINHRTGEPIGRAYVSRLMAEALPGRWTGHKLRHRYATVALDGTKDILAVGDQLGHAAASTTQRYCRVATDRLDAVAEAAAA